jgi:uncharacterized membrane protein YphA (DoxX/SURF4 family)
MLVSRELNDAYWALRLVLGLGLLIAGLDKFVNVLVDWGQYLSPAAAQLLPIGAAAFMEFAGAFEIVVGFAILFGASRTFGYIAMLWLWAIAANLISAGRYYDIALRDLVIGGSAYALARVSQARRSVLYVDEREEQESAA